jgi:phenylacetic acid degradation operon negative regulatory protein
MHGVARSSVIDAFGRIGITEDAVGTTLARMVKRGPLARRRRVRKMYFGLTAHASAVLRDGRDRVWRTGAVNRDWGDSWTPRRLCSTRWRRDTRNRRGGSPRGSWTRSSWSAPLRSAPCRCPG